MPQLRRIFEAAGLSVSSEFDRPVVDRGSSNLGGDRLSTRRAILDAAHRANEIRADSFDTNLDVSHQDELSLLQRDMPGFTILERLRSGGQGVVYRAIRNSNRQMVAIKVVLDGPFAAHRDRQRFQREVEIVSHLRHTNIVTVHESGAVQGRQFLVMEFIEGLTIEEYTLAHELSTRDVVQLFVKVCRAVAFAHRNGVIHRDLKPSNILIDHDDQPRILDFGLAKQLQSGNRGDASSMLSLSGELLGTMPFCGPEQLGAEDGNADVQTDIYSLGVILYLLLTESFPYAVDGGPLQTRQNILEALPRRMRSVAATNKDYRPGNEITTDLETIVAKALAKEKSRRYRSADEFADDLGRFLTGDAIQARSDSTLYTLRKLARKHRAIVTSAAVVVLSLIGAFIGVAMAWQRTHRAMETFENSLRLGAFLRTASVAHDDDRIDLALDLLEQAEQLGHSFKQTDTLPSLRLSYSLEQALGDIYSDRGKYDLAEKHARTALDIAQEMLKREPNDADTQTTLARSRSFMGRMHSRKSEWKEAVVDYDASITMFRNLLSQDQTKDIGGLQTVLAGVLGKQGEAFQNLREFDLAWDCYSESNAIQESLYRANPQHPERIVALSGTLVNLAAWHIKQRTIEGNQLAGKKLDEADALLTSAGTDSLDRTLRKTVQETVDAIRANRAILQKRALISGDF